MMYFTTDYRCGLGGYAGVGMWRRGDSDAAGEWVVDGGCWRMVGDRYVLVIMGIEAAWFAGITARERSGDGQ
jgi:hypothetical protein